MAIHINRRNLIEGEPDNLVITDAIGQGVDVELCRTRGIVSIVLLVDDKPTGPSAEIELEDLIEAVHALAIGTSPPNADYSRKV